MTNQKKRTVLFNRVSEFSHPNVTDSSVVEPISLNRQVVVASYCRGSLLLIHTEYNLWSGPFSSLLVLWLGSDVDTQFNSYHPMKSYYTTYFSLLLKTQQCLAGYITRHFGNDILNINSMFLRTQYTCCVYICYLLTRLLQINDQIHYKYLSLKRRVQNLEKKSPCSQ